MSMRAADTYHLFFNMRMNITASSKFAFTTSLFVKHKSIVTVNIQQCNISKHTKLCQAISYFRPSHRKSPHNLYILLRAGAYHYCCSVPVQEENSRFVHEFHKLDVYHTGGSKVHHIRGNILY